MIARRLSVVVMLVAGPTLAEPVPGGSLQVERTEAALGCPTELTLAQTVTAYGTAPTIAPETPIEITVRFDGDGASLQAVVRATGAKTGERLLRTEGLDCNKLAEATSVVVAVLLDLVPPEAAPSVDAFEEPPPPLAPPLAPPPAPIVPAPSPARPKPPEPSRPPVPRVQALLRGEASLALGALGGAVTPALGGLVTIRRGRWEAGLGGTWFAERRVPFPDIEGTYVNVGLALALAEGCLALATSASAAWDGWLCARVNAGSLSGAGHGFDRDEAHRTLWLGAGPTAAFRLRLTRVTSLRLSVGGTVTLGSHRFVVDAYGTAFDSPPLSGNVTIGPELSIL